VTCEHCTDDLRTFRMGRAHYACMECGKDVTMHIVCLQMAGIDISAIPVLTPDDYRPIADNKGV